MVDTDHNRGGPTDNGQKSAKRAEFFRCYGLMTFVVLGHFSSSLCSL